MFIFNSKKYQIFILILGEFDGINEMGRIKMFAVAEGYLALRPMSGGKSASTPFLCCA